VSRVPERRRLAAGFLIVLLVLSPAGHAQTDSLRSPSPGTRIGEDASTIVRITGLTLSAPTRWESGDFLRAGGIAALTAGTALLDRDMKDLAHRNRSSFGDRLTDVAVHYGEGGPMVLLMAGMYGAGLALENNWLRETAFLAGTAVVLSAGISTAGKFIVGRARPYAGLGNSDFKPFSGSDEFHSFPSGHTVAAFAFSAVLAERIKNPWATVGLYTAATACAYSRIYEDQHWLSDIVFSAAVSIAIAHSVVRWFEERPGPAGDAGFSVVPTGEGIVIIWRL
jgi:membrane-associated phospholipid phosphatase